MPLQIGLVARGSHLWLGGSYYIRNIVHTLNALPAELRRTFNLSLIVNDAEEREHFADVAPLVSRLIDGSSAQAPHSVMNRVRWRLERALTPVLNPRFEQMVLREKLDFVYPCFPRVGRSREYRFAAWIPDFQYRHFPEGSNAREVEGRVAEFRQITDGCPRIVLSSLAAEKDCHELFPISRGKTSVYRFRVRVLRSTPEDAEATIRKYGLPDRFLFCGNMFAPTKNHQVVFDALGKLRSSGIRPLLVCTGNLFDYRNPDFMSEVFRMIHCNRITDQVYLMGIIPKRQQLELLQSAIAVVQPSLFEGWSTVVEEARALGKVLIISDCPVHLEQDPPRARFFPARDADRLAELIREAWQGPPPADETAAAIADYEVAMEDAGRTFLRLAGA